MTFYLDPLGLREGIKVGEGSRLGVKVRGGSRVGVKIRVKVGGKGGGGVKVGVKVGGGSRSGVKGGVMVGGLGGGVGAVGFSGGRSEMKRKFLIEFHSIPFQSNSIHSFPCFTQCRLVWVKTEAYPTKHALTKSLSSLWSNDAM